MGQFGVGQSVRRKEDNRLLIGCGRYLDDIVLEDQAYAVVLRSPHANARILSIDTTEARKSAGVLNIFTARDIESAGVTGIPCKVKVPSRDGLEMANPLRPLLAKEQVRFVGDYVALIVAESLKQARHARDLVLVDYEVEASITDTAETTLPESPQVWAEHPGNRVFDWEKGDRGKVDEIFANAKHVYGVDLVNNRVVVNSMEPRGALGAYDKKTSRYTLYTPCQHVHLMREIIAGALNIEEDDLRVVSPDVGGGFGMKVFVYPEQALVPYAAKQLGRPVKWTSLVIRKDETTLRTRKWLWMSTVNFLL